MTPYRWAHYIDVPFQLLVKPLDQCRVALITTAAPFEPDKGDQGPGASYNGGAKFYAVYEGDSSRRMICGSRMSPSIAHTTAEDREPGFRCRACSRRVRGDR